MEPGKQTRREPKMNMAEKLVDVVANLRQRGKKDQPPKLLCNINMVLKHRYPFFFGSVGQCSMEKMALYVRPSNKRFIIPLQKGVIFRA